MITSLNSDWFYTTPIDPEYKQYFLLAYFQHINSKLKQVELYPFFTDLITHHQNLLTFRDSQQILKASFSKQLKTIDLDKLELQYESVDTGPKELQQIDEIVEFAIPKFQQHLRTGKQIYDQIDDNVTIQPIGIISPDTSLGYLLVRNDKQIKSYQYEVTIFETSQDKYRAIHLTYLRSFKYSLTNTYEKIKQKLTDTTRVPLAMTFAVESQIKIPLESTLLPIVKRKLLRLITL